MRASRPAVRLIPLVRARIFSRSTRTSAICTSDGAAGAFVLRNLNAATFSP